MLQAIEYVVAALACVAVGPVIGVIIVVTIRIMDWLERRLDDRQIERRLRKWHKARERVYETQDPSNP